MDKKTIITGIGGVLLAGAAAYFMATTVRLSGERRGISAFTRQESACMVLTGCVLIAR